MIEGFISDSIVKRACAKRLAEIELINLRDFAIDDYGTVDDRPYGGGAGMVLRIEPICKALQKLKVQNSKLKTTTKNLKLKTKIILTNPRGEVYNQEKAKEYSKLDHLIIIAGHYEGVDERVMDYIDEEISLGDFIMTGGEIASVAIVDSVIRLLSGVLKKEEAIQQESFFSVPIDILERVVGKNEILQKLKTKGVKAIKLLEYPHYTRPEEYDGKKVPELLLSGDQKKINDWRLRKAYQETINKRQDLLK